MSAGPGASLEDLVAGLERRLRSSFPGRLRGIYLLGSRAAGRNLPGSDVDLGLVFSGLLDRTARDQVWSAAKAAADGGPHLVDLTLLDDADLARGVKPYAKEGRLLAGEDALAGCPLLPPGALLAAYALSGLYYLWLVRGQPEALPRPLAFPSPAGEFRGYEEAGIWVARERFAPGFNTLHNLVASIGNFRIGAAAGFFFGSKHDTAAHYRRLLPADPWEPMLAEIQEICRGRWSGAVPPPGEDRRRLAQWCGRMPEFENLFLGEMIPQLPRLAAAAAPDVRARLARFLPRLRGLSEAEERALESSRRTLAGGG